jgi:hypothetical protein
MHSINAISQGKPRLPLCLANRALRHEDVERGHIDPRFHGRGNNWTWVDSITTRPFYHGNVPLYPLNKRLNGAQRRIGRYRAKMLDCNRNWTPTLWRPAIPTELPLLFLSSEANKQTIVLLNASIHLKQLYLQCCKLAKVQNCQQEPRSTIRNNRTRIQPRAHNEDCWRVN